VHGPGGRGRLLLRGTLAYLFAATTRVEGRGPDAAVSYYGSGVHTMLNLMDQIECPLLFHYGARDPFIPGDQIDLVESAAAGRDRVTLQRYDAGHAFSNWDAPSMYDKEAADLAWERTVAFLDRHLKGGAGA
jgi:carboxymethylenebutenolidase